MIWNSMVAMSVFDVFFIAATATVIYVLITQGKAIAFAGAQTYLRILMAGIIVWSSIYVADLIIMLVGPIFVSRMAAMEAMTFLHQNARWVIDAAAIGLLVAGFVGLVRHFNRLLETMQVNSEALQIELDTQTTLHDELKDKARSERMTSRSKSEFLLGLSHELRTPLNGIIGLTGLLANTELEDDQRKLLTTLEQSAQAMLTRVNDVLDLSKLESGQVQLRSVPFRPADLVQAVEALFAPLASKKGLAFSAHASELARRTVIGDHMLIKQIICNLVSNAIKYTPTGSIRIVADVRETDSERVWLQFSVIDTGVGMDAERVARVSKPSQSMDETDGELGLGLSIAWRLAELMDGDISVESEPDKGAAFTVRLQVQNEPRADEEDLVAGAA